MSDILTDLIFPIIAGAVGGSFVWWVSDYCNRRRLRPGLHLAQYTPPKDTHQPAALYLSIHNASPRPVYIIAVEAYRCVRQRPPIRAEYRCEEPLIAAAFLPMDDNLPDTIPPGRTVKVAYNLPALCGAARCRQNCPAVRLEIHVQTLFHKTLSEAITLQCLQEH